MSGSAKTKYDVEEAFTVTTGDCETAPTETKTSCTDDSYSNVGLWICAIILVVIFTVAIWGGFAWCNSSWKGKGKKKGNVGGGCGMIGLFLVWLIIVIIFLCAVWKCGWGAVVGFLILIIIIAILCGMWSCFAGSNDGDRDRCRDY